MFSNIYQHPKTSIAGVLLAVVTIAGVLSQQGITLGNAGTGTVLALISGLATAFLGLLAKDPDAPTSSTTGKAAMVALCAVIIGGTCFLGCKTVNSPLPTNAVNATDAGINEVLQAAHAYVVQWQSDVTAGKHVPTAAEKAIFAKVIADLNVADPLFQQFHAALVANAAAGEPSTLTAALAAVTADLAQLTALAK